MEAIRQGPGRNSGLRRVGLGGRLSGRYLSIVSLSVMCLWTSFTSSSKDRKRAKDVGRNGRISA